MKVCCSCWFLILSSNYQQFITNIFIIVEAYHFLLIYMLRRMICVSCYVPIALVTLLDLFSVFGHQNNPAHLTRFPRVVVISYTMLRHLRNSIFEQDWALLIVDESHHLRCSKKKSEPQEVKSYLFCKKLKFT